MEDWFVWYVRVKLRLPYFIDTDGNSFHLYRKKKRSFIDEFIVIRTSKRCFRISYYNFLSDHFYYVSAPDFRCAGDIIQSIYDRFGNS